MNSVVEIIIIFALLLGNGLLAMTEFAIVSSRKAKLAQLAAEGDSQSQLALDLANSPSSFLSTVQIGITLIGIFAGAFGGATLVDELADYFKTIPAITEHADRSAFAIVVALTTYFSLVIGELVPKRLALHAPEKIARLMAMPIRVLSQLTAPIVSLLTASTNFVISLAGLKTDGQAPVTEAEIHLLLDQATRAGVFEETEQDMVKTVLTLGDRKVSSLMTPRSHVMWIDSTANEQDILKFIAEHSHARYPVCKGTVDHVLGIVESQSILLTKTQGQQLNLESLVIAPPYIPETINGLQLLQRFRDTKQRMALILDEYGAWQGLVTHEDVFQAIVGELHLEGDTPKWEAVQREDGSWILDAHMPIQQFKKKFDIDKLPGEGEADYETVAGFILTHLEHVPEAGENFDVEGLHFEVIDMDGHRIDKVLVARLGNR